MQALFLFDISQLGKTKPAANSSLGDFHKAADALEIG